LGKTAKRQLTEAEEEAEFARLARWDAKIEADFQDAVAQTGAASKAKRGRRHVGFPWAFYIDACRLTDGHNDLAVALYIYRRTKVCNSLTVTLPGSELAELGINRRRKHEALAKLAAAGLVRLEKATGQSTRVTLLWKEPVQ
jgi:hypothetical protein